jgi:hypothetical protein
MTRRIHAGQSPTIYTIFVRLAPLFCEHDLGFPSSCTLAVDMSSVAQDARIWNLVSRSLEDMKSSAAKSEEERQSKVDAKLRGRLWEILVRIVCLTECAHAEKSECVQIRYTSRHRNTISLS